MPPPDVPLAAGASGDQDEDAPAESDALVAAPPQLRDRLKAIKFKNMWETLPDAIKMRFEMAASRAEASGIINDLLVPKANGRGFELIGNWMEQPMFQETNFKQEAKSLASDQLGRAGCIPPAWSASTARRWQTPPPRQSTWARTPA